MHAIVDSHVHLDHTDFNADRAQVLARAQAQGVDTLIIPAVERNGWAGIRHLCAGDRRLHAAYGLHPLFVDHHAPSDVQALSAWLEAGDAVAIGEIGLDFHDKATDRDRQRRFFQAQLRLARERGLPVIVHARAAFEEAILTLRDIGGLRGVVHSFSGSQQQASRLWELGFCLGVGGPVTYPRARRLRQIVATMPAEFLLLESDAPDQPDAGIRGQRNEPARVASIAQSIAELRGESLATLATTTTANAYRVFGLDAKQS